MSKTTAKTMTKTATADQLKDLDKEIVINSMDVQWQNIMIDFVKLLQPLNANVRQI